MRSRYPVKQTMDLVIGQRVFNGCWLSASLGISIVQMLFLAQAWHVSQHALVPACMMSFWTLGSLVGSRVRNAPRRWGGRWFVCALLWFGGTSSLVSWRLSLDALLPALLSIVTLAMVALLLGASSTAWLSQQRSWPSVGERTVLVRSLMGFTIGLVVVWLLPTWAGLIALTCCLPMLALDFLPTWGGPLPSPGGVAGGWIGRYWTADRWQLLLDERVLPRNWWRSCSTASRGDLPLTLLPSSVAVMLGSIWGAIPTPFAAGLSATHSLDKLCWLLGGQLGILLVGMCCLLAARGVIGLPDRPLPTALQPRLRFLLLLMPAGMAGSLVALGLPFLQDPWWLALSLASYTLTDAIWGLLLPGLRPGLGTKVLKQRHLLPGQSKGWQGMLQLPYERACAARAGLLLATLEGLLIAATTLVIGWLIDWRGSVDEALIMVGLVFLLSLACILGGHALIVFARRPSQVRSHLTFSRCSTGSVFPHVKTAANR
jgi:hypothetical protein